MINYEYQDLQIASLQIYESLKWAQKNNLTYLDIGVSQLYKDDKIIPHDSLINFKEQFGAQAMIRKVIKLYLSLFNKFSNKTKASFLYSTKGSL